MSCIGWIDFSSDDRARVREVLALLKEQGTLDELGIGQVRDAFSDLLFPGFSTIQTRARYFLAIPKILRDWAELTPSNRRKRPLADYLQDQENKLAQTLKENHLARGISLDGVIGHTKVESGGVSRRPSETYWGGLRKFGIVRTEKSLAEFCRDWRRDHAGFDVVESEEGRDDGDFRHEAIVRHLPGTNGAWPPGMTLNLTRREASFLSEQICTGGRMLEHSVAAQLLESSLAGTATGKSFEDFKAFSHWVANETRISRNCRKLVVDAQRFSDAIEGAHIIYNRLLAEKLEDDTLRNYCIREYESWHDHTKVQQVFDEMASLKWLQYVGFAGGRVNDLSVRFLNAWNDAMCQSAPMNELERLVAMQVEKNKPGRSLLVKLPRKRSYWYGMKNLDYRWQTARRMLSDVVKGLACSA